MRRQSLGSGLLALPGGEVAVLNRQIGEGAGPALGIRGVKGGKFPGKNAIRPGVANEMMPRDEKRVILFVESKQCRLPERPAFEVKGAADFLEREEVQLRGGGAERGVNRSGTNGLNGSGCGRPSTRPSET